MTLILGRKIGMTQLFAEDGTVAGVTVVEAGPCVVTQIRTEENDGYNAVQLGFEDMPDRLVAKPQRGHFAKNEIAPKRFLREERLNGPAECEIGDVVKADAFEEGDLVDVIGHLWHPCCPGTTSERRPGGRSLGGGGAAHGSTGEDSTVKSGS